MRRTLLSFSVVLLALAVITGAAGAQGPDPFVGTWKLNPAKSKYHLGPVSFAVNTTTFQPSGANGLKFTSDRVTQDGQKEHIEFTANFDGKTYPYKVSTPNPSRDGVSIKRLDSHNLQISYKKGGETTQINYFVVAKDGRSMSVVSTGVGADNQVYSRITFNDKQ